VLPNDSLVVFTIPDSFDLVVYDNASGQTVIKKYSSISDSCLIKLSDYQEWTYLGFSYCYFSIQD